MCLHDNAWQGSPYPCFPRALVAIFSNVRSKFAKVPDVSLIILCEPVVSEFRQDSIKVEIIVNHSSGNTFDDPSFTSNNELIPSGVALLGAILDKSNSGF